MIILALLYSFSASALLSERPPLTMACVATDDRGARDEFEFQFHSAVRSFNLFESNGSSRISVGPFPLMQVHIEKPAFGFSMAKYEVRLGLRGNELGVVEVQGGFLGRFGETKVAEGSVSGRGFELRVWRGDANLHLTCARNR